MSHQLPEGLETAVRKWASTTSLDADKYVAMAREFYNECPHMEAVLEYLVMEASLELADKPEAARLPIEALIDAAVKLKVDRMVSVQEEKKKEN